MIETLKYSLWWCKKREELAILGKSLESRSSAGVDNNKIDMPVRADNQHPTGTSIIVLMGAGRTQTISKLCCYIEAPTHNQK